jgi:MDMPI C-terminal domain
VHRVDLEQSLGIDWRIDPDVAVDGIDEVLTLWLTGRMPPGLTGSGRAVRLQAWGPDDDSLVDRVIRPYGQSVHFSPYEPGQRVDAELSGPVDAVWAWCWGRVDSNDPAHPVVIEGDIGAVDELRGALAAAEQ